MKYIRSFGKLQLNYLKTVDKILGKSDGYNWEIEVIFHSQAPFSSSGFGGINTNMCSLHFWMQVQLNFK